MDLITQYYALLNPSEEFIQKVYRQGLTKINDGTFTESLQYYGEQGGWHGSTVDPRDEFISRLHLITPERASELTNTECKIKLSL